MQRAILTRSLFSMRDINVSMMVWLSGQWRVQSTAVLLHPPSRPPFLSPGEGSNPRRNSLASSSVFNAFKLLFDTQPSIHTHSLSLSRQFYFLTRFRNRHSVKRWLCFWLAGRRLGVWFSPIVRKLSCLCLRDSNVYIYICTYSRHNTLVITWNICINWKKRIARQIVHTII